jgi:ABC-2 type transport system ATP-binding protein
MMGLTPKEMRQRLDAIIEFAELEDFADLKLKNYSSGMLVRLAFAVMMEADADVLLIDEVLAVGDAAFQQKCADAFHQMKAEGKTIILVTHEMATVEDYCHRAMLIADGEIQHIGDPGEVGREYLRLNFEGGADEGAIEGEEVRLLEARLEGADGEPTANVEHGEELRLRLELEIKRDLPGLDVGFLLANADNLSVFNFGIPVGEREGARELKAGQRVTVSAAIDNQLAAGRYFVHCGINRAYEGGIALYVPKAIDFVVFGGPQTRGVVLPELKIDAAIEGGNR